MNKKKFSIMIIATITIFLIVNLVTASLIEYYFAKGTYRLPILALKSESEAKQYTKYTALFYKVYKCYSDFVIVQGAKEKEPYCGRIIRYNQDGYYVNYHDIKIAKKDFQLIFDKSVTFKEIDNFTTYKDLEDAEYVIDEYERSLHQTYKTVTINNEEVSIEVFPEFVQVNEYGDYDWRYQSDDPSYYKCMKGNLYKTYKDDKTCTGEWTDLTYSDKWCNLAKTNSISSIQGAHKNNCE